MKEHQSKSFSVLRWLKKAEADFDAAQDSLKSSHFEWACFQAQQVAEKALRAFLYSQGLRAIITHSTAELLAEAQTFASFDIPQKFAHGFIFCNYCFCTHNRSPVDSRFRWNYHGIAKTLYRVILI